MTTTATALDRAALADWYRRNREWITRVKSGEYQDYYKLNYTR